MKCLEVSEIEELAFEKDKNSVKNNHIRNCRYCKQTYHKVLNEHYKLRYIFSSKVPDEINQNVMQRIYTHVTKEKLTSNVGHQKKRKKQRLLAIFASVTLLMGSFLYISGPIIADAFKSMFSADSTDSGLLRAKDYGTILNPEVLVSDQDYTLKINEVSADAGRIVMALQLFSSSESSSAGMLNLGKENHIYVQDENGNILGEFTNVGKTNDYYQLSVIFPEIIKSESIKIVGNINHLGGTVDNKTIIKGDWNFDFNLNLNKANQITKVKEFNQSYSVPNSNISVQVDRLVKTPSSTRLEMMTTSTSDKSKVQGLMFHFEDEAGDEIHSVGSTKTGHKEALLDIHQYADNKDKKIMHWSYTFIDVPDDATFVFDGLSLLEEDGSSVNFQFSDLKQSAIAFEGKDKKNQINLNDFLTSFEGKEENQITIKINGYSQSEFLNDQWVIQRIKDSTNYNVQFKGGLSPSGTGTEISNNSEFVIDGLTDTDGDFKLIRTFIERKYTSVDWSIDLSEE